MQVAPPHALTVEADKKFSLNVQVSVDNLANLGSSGKRQKLEESSSFCRFSELHRVLSRSRSHALTVEADKIFLSASTVSALALCLQHIHVCSDLAEAGPMH